MRNRCLLLCSIFVTVTICISSTVMAGLAADSRIIGGGSVGWKNWHTEGESWHLSSLSRKADPCPNDTQMESGESATGILRSPVFTIQGDIIRFWANGWHGSRRSGQNAFNLRLARDNSILRTSYPSDSDDFSPIEWFVRDIKGKEVYFEAIDGVSASGFAWLGLALVEECKMDKASGNTAFYSLQFDDGLSGTWSIMHTFSPILHTPGSLSSLANGEAAVGTIESPEFTVSTDKIRLMLRGWDGRYGEKNVNFVELVDAKTGESLRKVKPPLTDNPVEVNLDVADLFGRKVFLSFTDGDTGGSFAWLAIDEIDAGESFHVRFSENPDLRGWTNASTHRVFIDKDGIPFLADTESVVPNNGACRASLGFKADKLFILGMTTTLDMGCPVWGDPRDIKNRFWLGDQLGTLRVKYSDGVTETYPLILGDNLWWGWIFYTNQEPFASDPHAQQVLKDCLNLYPQKPTSDCKYVAVISPRNAKIDSIEIADADSKSGGPVILGLTAMTSIAEDVPAKTTLHSPGITPEMSMFIAKHCMKPQGVGENEAKAKLERLKSVLYVDQSKIDAHKSVNTLPAGYKGPFVSFKGNAYADILTSMFYYNVKDICDKVDPDGFYNTSTKGAPSWGGYCGFGTFSKDVSSYHGQCWNRDMGRSMMELSALGFLDKCTSVADLTFRYARAWEDPNQPGIKLMENKSLLDGQKLPRHVPRRMNYLNTTPGEGCFDNDSHGLTGLFIYNLWKRLPDRDTWLHSNWEDVKGLGDWIVWQYVNPKLSGATEVLRTDSESSGGVGYSVYPDVICMEMLKGLAEMADSIGENDKAAEWRKTANRLKNGIESAYIVDDHIYGRVWTLNYAGWPNKSTVLGPVIISSDIAGFAPEDIDPNWRKVTETTYKQLLNIYNMPRVFGYFGTAMGYGQGFFTQAALLLDKMNDAEKMLEWAARLTYDPRYESYIVPEGCELAPDGKFWHRTSDLGNGVQEAEIIKTLRIVIGVDDNNPDNLRIFPRMPFGWSEITIKDYPALVKISGSIKQVPISYKLTRSTDGMHIQVNSKTPLPSVELRLGPFESDPTGAKVLVCDHPFDSKIEISGDSWWVRVIIPSRITSFTADVNQ